MSSSARALSDRGQGVAAEDSEFHLAGTQHPSTELAWPHPLRLSHPGIPDWQDCLLLSPRACPCGSSTPFSQPAPGGLQGGKFPLRNVPSASGGWTDHRSCWELSLPIHKRGHHHPCLFQSTVGHMRARNSQGRAESGKACAKIGDQQVGIVDFPAPCLRPCALRCLQYPAPSVECLQEESSMSHQEKLK